MLIFILAVELEAGNWIFACGFEGRVDTEEYTYDETDCSCDTEDLPGNVWREWRNERD